MGGDTGAGKAISWFTMVVVVGSIPQFLLLITALCM